MFHKAKLWDKTHISSLLYKSWFKISSNANPVYSNVVTRVFLFNHILKSNCFWVNLSYKFFMIYVLNLKFYYSCILVLGSLFSHLMWVAAFTRYVITMQIVILLKLLSNNYSTFNSYQLLPWDDLKPWKGCTISGI